MNEKMKTEDLFGPSCSNPVELVENFCVMHFGVNLHKAFLDDTKSYTTTVTAEIYMSKSLHLGCFVVVMVWM